MNKIYFLSCIVHRSASCVCTAIAGVRLFVCTCQATEGHMQGNLNQNVYSYLKIDT
jgi:hypothetical protein